MNIFNRNKSLDDLPGREEMPRPKLPEFDREMERVVQDRIARPLTIDERREKLDFHLDEFQRHAAAARKEAEIYMHQHVALIEELSEEKAKLEEWQAHLDKLEANLPKFGGKDDQDKLIDRDPELAGSGKPSDSKDESGSRPKLSIADRRPKPIQT